MGDQGNVRQLTIETKVVPIVARPHSVPAEQALLGALMVNNRLYDQLDGKLRPEHFYIPLHSAVFEALERIINQRGGEANPITLQQEMRASPFDVEQQLLPHLSSMFENASLATNIKTLAEVIHTTYLQRQLMGLGDNIKQEGEKATRPEVVEEVIMSAGDELYRLSAAGNARAPRSARESLKAMLAHAETARSAKGGITGIGTGLIDLDKLLGGLQRSDFIVLGARPSMGKTSLLLNIAQHAAQALVDGKDHGAAVGVFSLEMSDEQLMQRLAAGVAGLDSQRIANGQMSDKDMDRLMQATATLAELPLHVDDTPAMSIGMMRSRARQMKRQYGIGLLVVDYMQLMTAPGRRNDESRVQEVSEISRGLKQIARELDIPVLVAAQLSRNVENRDNKRPILADLRESGSIEQDADVVAFLYRPEYYLKQQLGGASEITAGSDAERKRVLEASSQLEKARGITELIVAKNRKGPTDTVRLLFKPDTTTFHSFAANI